VSRATGRAGPEDLVDPDPVHAVYDAFSDLGAFESHVIDSSDQPLSATIAALKHGLDAGTFDLTRT
jgi:hypothetical protein